MFTPQPRHTRLTFSLPSGTVGTVITKKQGSFLHRSRGYLDGYALVESLVWKLRLNLISESNGLPSKKRIWAIFDNFPKFKRLKHKFETPLKYTSSVVPEMLLKNPERSLCIVETIHILRYARNIKPGLFDDTYNDRKTLRDKKNTRCTHSVKIIWCRYNNELENQRKRFHGKIRRNVFFLQNFFHPNVTIR